MPGAIYVKHVAELPRESRYEGAYERTGVVMDAANISFVWVTPDIYEGHTDDDGKAPGHHHPFDQIVYVVEGEMRMWIGEEVHDIGPGDVCYIPRDVPHGGRPINGKPVHIMEIFAPIRTDYLYTAEHQLAFGQAERESDGSRTDRRSLRKTRESVRDSTLTTYGQTSDR
jgi:mannose-6-phosphate isomerase-like protein (cupin superfamily)